MANKESRDAYGRRRSEAERYDDEQYRHVSELRSQLLASKDEIADLRAELHQSRAENESLLDDQKLHYLPLISTAYSPTFAFLVLL